CSRPEGEDRVEVAPTSPGRRAAPVRLRARSTPHACGRTGARLVPRSPTGRGGGSCPARSGKRGGGRLPRAREAGGQQGGALREGAVRQGRGRVRGPGREEVGHAESGGEDR